MTASEIQPYLRAEPFKPLTIVTARNGSIPVTRPDAVLLATTQLYIGWEFDSSGVPSKVSIIPLLQIRQIKPMD
ncbi:MAG TPA: hypothetical protein VGB55_05560 [Tepidisphaeraceae bacterium]|jgi:hypothetical protein